MVYNIPYAYGMRRYCNIWQKSSVFCIQSGQQKLDDKKEEDVLMDAIRLFYCYGMVDSGRQQLKLASSRHGVWSQFIAR